MSDSEPSTQQEQPQQPAPVSAFPELRRRPKNIIKQIEDAAAFKSDSDVSNVAELPQLFWGDRRFVMEDHLYRENSRGRRTWVKDHGYFLAELERNLDVKGVIWVCRRCAPSRPQIFAAKSTSSPMRHLQEEHSIRENSGVEGHPQAVLDLQEAAASKRPALSVITKMQATSVHDFAIGAIIYSNLPFNHYENPFTHGLHGFLNTKLANAVSLGRAKMTKELERVYKDGKATVQCDLSQAVSSIHFSFDLWTSPNLYSMTAVIAHFIDVKLRPQTRLLALRRHDESHCGEEIANTIEGVINEWDIGHRIGVAICDNASNNDTCLNSLYPRLDPSLTLIDIKHRRMRCFGHILNLVARAFLYGNDAKAFEVDSDRLELLGDQAAVLNHRRRKGPVGKLHNVIKYIRKTPQRVAAFQRIALEDFNNEDPDNFTLGRLSDIELSLRQNNETRWNSTYLMIERALRKESHIKIYLDSIEFRGPASGRLPAEDHLSPDDWRMLHQIEYALEPIYRLTMWAQTDTNFQDGKGQLCTVLTGMDYVIRHFEDLNMLYTQEDVNMESTTEPAPHNSSQSSQHEFHQARQSDEMPFSENSDFDPVWAAAINSSQKAFMRVSTNNECLIDQQRMFNLGQGVVGRHSHEGFLA